MPIIFWVCLIGLIGVVAAFVILELARPYPDERKRREAERHKQDVEDRHAARDKRLSDAEEKVHEEIEKDIQESIAKGLTHESHYSNPVEPDVLFGENIPEPDNCDIPKNPDPVKNSTRPRLIEIDLLNDEKVSANKKRKKKR